MLNENLFQWSSARNIETVAFSQKIIWLQMTSSSKGQQLKQFFMIRIYDWKVKRYQSELFNAKECHPDLISFNYCFPLIHRLNGFFPMTSNHFCFSQLPADFHSSRYLRITWLHIFLGCFLSALPATSNFWHLLDQERSSILFCKHAFMVFNCCLLLISIRNPILWNIHLTLPALFLSSLITSPSTDQGLFPFSIRTQAK